MVRLMSGKPEAAAQLARALPYIGKSGSGDDRIDAIRVADAIEKLVSELGLETKLSEYTVGEDQVSVVAKKATRQESGPLFEGVKRIVQSKL